MNDKELIERAEKYIDMITNISDAEKPVQTYTQDRELIQDLLTAYKALRGANQWRDIETAPRDGSEILCWVRDCEEHQVLWWCDAGHWRRWGDTYENYAPTHWMPLPTAPVIKESTLKGAI